MLDENEYSPQKDFRGNDKIRTNNQEITLDKERYSTLNFSSKEEINFKNFSVNLRNITREQLIKIMEVLRK